MFPVLVAEAGLTGAIVPALCLFGACAGKEIYQKRKDNEELRLEREHSALSESMPLVPSFKK